ncbi:MAG: ribose transport system substrate-binding protein [Micromonosporaceae bacterium]|jgi:ribose transport system substrate-binding protein|nr:ribose transport system substrate-binding protein [Micromonosporaceae bacterium]
MQRRSHIAAVLVAAGLIIASTGCSSKAGDGNEQRTVAFVIPATDLSVAVEMADGFKVGAQQVGGVEPVVAGPSSMDGQKQLEIFQGLTKTSRTGISIFTLTPDLLAQPLADAAKSGVPLIAVDNPPPPSSNVKLFIGNDNYRLGQQLADEVIAKLPPNATGKVVVGTSQPGVPVLDQRASGMRDEIRKKLPGATVVGPFDSGRGGPPNLASWTTLVKANPTALAFMGTGSEDSYNLASIHKSMKASWLAAGFDLEPMSLQGVKDGDVLVMSPEHFVKGALAGRLQAKHAKDGKPLPEGWLYTPGLVVNQSNVDAIMARQATVEAKKAFFTPEIDKILKDKSYLRPLSQAG